MSPENFTLTVNETQHLPHFDKTGSSDGISCLNWIVYNGRRKVWVNFETDTDKLNYVLYRYLNNLYFKRKQNQSEIHKNLRKFEKTSLSIELNSHFFFQAVFCTRWKHCS